MALADWSCVPNPSLRWQPVRQRIPLRYFLWATAEPVMIYRGSLMSSDCVSVAHTPGYVRVTLSIVLFLVVVRRRTLQRVSTFRCLYRLDRPGRYRLHVHELCSLCYWPPVLRRHDHQQWSGSSPRLRDHLPDAQDKIAPATPQLAAWGSPLFKRPLCSLWPSRSPWPGSRPYRTRPVWTSIYRLVQRTLRILQCGQLVFLFLFSNYFRLSWRNRAFGIALGLGILPAARAWQSMRFIPRLRRFCTGIGIYYTLASGE